MNFIKIGKMLCDPSAIDLIDLEHYEPLDKTPYVKIQMKNRRDEVQWVTNPETRRLEKVTKKYGVIVLPADLSEKFRWFIKEMGPGYGILDLEEIWSRRDQIKAAVEELKRKQANTTQPALKPLGR